MMHSFKQSLLALVCAVGLTAAPQAQAHNLPIPHTTKGRVIGALVLWETFSLIHMAYKGSKPVFQKQALLDMSRDLMKNNPTQWSKNVAKNLWILQTDYFEGQSFKPKGLSVNDGKVESSEKCLPAGFNGHLLSMIASANKGLKNLKEIAPLVILFVFLKNGSINWEKLANVMGWSKDLVEMLKDDVAQEFEWQRTRATTVVTI